MGAAPLPPLSGCLLPEYIGGPHAHWRQTRVAAFGEWNEDGTSLRRICIVSASVLSEILFISWHLGVADCACLCLFMIWSYTRELLALFYGCVGFFFSQNQKSYLTSKINSDLPISNIPI